MSKADPGLDAPRKFALELQLGDPAVAERILALLSEGPMKPAAIREAVGIRSRIHFNNRYTISRRYWRRDSSSGMILTSELAGSGV